MVGGQGRRRSQASPCQEQENGGGRRHEGGRPEEIGGAARLWVVVDSNTDGYNCKKLRLCFCTRGLGELIGGVVRVLHDLLHIDVLAIQKERMSTL